jgi:hypothetical protein
MLLLAGCGGEPEPPAAATPPTQTDPTWFEPEEEARAATPSTHTGSPWFESQEEARGVQFTLDTELSKQHWMPEIIVGGGAALDFDDDGWMDLYLLQASGEGGNRLLHNVGDGTFEDVTEGSGAGDVGYASGVAAGDIDGDGDVDLFVSNLDADVLLRNDGDGHFTDISDQSDIGDEQWGTSATFLDADADGDLDLFVCRYVQWSPETVLPCLGIGFNDLETPDYCKPNRYPPSTDLFYLNDGEGRFTDAAEASGIGSVQGYGLGVVAADFNGDGATDMFVANDTMPDRFWQNNGDGTFEEAGFNMACDRDNTGLAKAGMGVSVADVNDDGAPDLIVCNLKGETDSLYINKGTYFRDMTSQAGLSGESFGYTRFGLGLVDFDNDGRLDYFAANGAVLADPDVTEGDPYAHDNLLLQGRTDRMGFKPIDHGGITSLPARTSRGAIFADFDNDGGMDIVVLNRNAPARVLANTVADRGNWLLVDARDASGAPAIGARVEVDVGDLTRTGFVQAGSSYLTARDPRVHFGLGEHTRVSEVRVLWPGGDRVRLRDVPTNRVLRVDRPSP